MQKTYFLYENGQPSPPYTIEELRAKHLTGDTMICEKFGTWKPVRELPELQELWEWAPPPPQSPDWSPPAPPRPEVPGQHTPDNASAGAESIVATRRPWIPASFGLAVLCFFFVFCDLKCGEQKIASVTGIQFVMGTTIAGPGTEGLTENEGRKIPPSMWAIVALIAGLMGGGIYLFSKTEGSGTGIAFGAIGAVSMLILQAQVKTGFEKESEGILIAEFQPAYWLSLLAMIAAAVISGTLPSRPAKVNTSPLAEPPPPLKEVTDEPGSDTIVKEPEILFQESKVKAPDDGGLSKNIKIVGAGIAGFVLLIVGGYFFFLKPNLEKKSYSRQNSILNEPVIADPAPLSTAPETVKKEKAVSMPIITQKEQNDKNSGLYNLDRHSKINIFIDDLSKAVKDGDKNTIAQMIHFPLIDEYGDNPGNQAPSYGCKNSSDFLSKYDKIFTASTKNAIISKKYRGVQHDELHGDVIEEGEFLIENDQQINMLGIKKINGKYKIYALKFYS